VALLGYVPAVGGGSDARRASASPWALLERDDLRPVRSRTKTLLWIAEATSGPMLAMMARAVRPLVADGYDVWLASLRPNMPDGYTVADMAEDFAGLITDEFDGRVDLVVGHSTGG
jgi:hypothetical protein